MALQAASPDDPIRLDCMAVLKGAQLGSEWANSPSRILARAWGPVSSCLEGDCSRLAWMPAHCTIKQIAGRKLSDGDAMSEVDLKGNDYVDGKAEGVARGECISGALLKEISSCSARVTAIATWLGQITEFANRFPDPRVGSGEKRKFLRDSEGHAAAKSSASRGVKRKQVTVLPVPGDLSLCPWWERLPQRVLLKESATAHS